MMRNLIFVVVVLFLSVVVANAEVRELERAEHCIDWYDTNGRDDLRMTEDIVFSGDPMVFNGWTVPYNTLTIQFAEEEPIIWSPDTAVDIPNEEYLGALGDWIWTAIKLEEAHGFKSFAVQTPEGNTWLVSQFIYEGKPECLAHPLWLN